MNYKKIFENYLNESKSGDYTAAVLAIGIINITTGKTKYGWSIYDSPKATIYLTKYGGFLLFSDDYFSIGDEITLRHNDTNRKLKSDTILDSSPSNYKDVIKMLHDNKYDYSPKKPFAKNKWPNKLSTSYSVKGVWKTK